MVYDACAASARGPRTQIVNGQGGQRGARHQATDDARVLEARQREAAAAGRRACSDRAVGAGCGRAIT